jgi:hypothetical protein
MSVIAEIQLQQPKPDHGFQPGHAKLGGRQRGTRNRVGGDLRLAIVTALHETGFIGRTKKGKPVATGEGGVVGYLKWLALHEPRTTAALFARVLPFFIETEAPPPVMSRAELEAEFMDLGLPFGLIDFLQRAPAPLDKNEDPDPWGLRKGDTEKGVPVDAKDVSDV